MKKQTNSPVLIVAVAAFAAFLATFNETFMNVGFTNIMENLHVDIATVQWLATAYMLGAAVMVPISAFVYRKIPTKPLFLATVGMLTLGSLIGAVAQSFAVLLIGRIVQSLGTGLLIPIGMNITLEVAPREKLGSYLGIMGAMTTLGPSLSVILAGLLLSVGSWHILMWFFGGLCLILFIFAAIFLKNVAHLTKPKLDGISVSLVGLSLIGLLYGVSTIFQGNIVIAVAAIICGGLLMTCFIYRQKKLKEPLINLQPFSVKAFRVGVLINMLSLIIIFAMNIVTPMFVQACGASAMSASLILFPAILLSCVISPIAGKIYDKRGARLLLPLGFILITAFCIGLSVFKDAGSLAMSILYIPVICGSALIIGPVQSFSLSKLRPEQNPHGVTVMSTAFQIAGCVGSSVFTGIYGLIVARNIGSVGMQQASGKGFLIVSLVAAACAIVGFLLAMGIRAMEIEKKTQAEKPIGQFNLQNLMKKEVYSISNEATVLEALKLIVAKKISGAPVVDEKNNVIGFISDGDILGYLGKVHPLYTNIYAIAFADMEKDFNSKIRDAIEKKVKDIATKKLITVDIHDEIAEVCDKLYVNHLKKAPVMEDGKMVGIINRSNITKYITNEFLSTVE